MNVRVIFRGLILFRFEKSRDQVQPDAHRGRLTAQMINDSGSHGVHFHTPRIALIGRDAETRDEILGQHYPICGQTVELVFPRREGVTPQPSFNEYVPRLSEVFGIPRSEGAWSPRQREQERDDRLVAAKVVVPAGRIHARSPVTWRDVALKGLEVPAKVKFLKVAEERLVAGECVLEVDAPNWKSVRINSSGPIVGMPRELLALTEAGEPHHRHLCRDEVAPDTIDILVTNFAPQRLQPVPWSLHYQLLFRAAGYEEMNLTGDQELEEFVAAAEKNYRDEWKIDSRHFGWENPKERKGYPFPYLKTGLLTGPDRSAEDEAARAAELSITKDPQNRPLCPQGDED